MTTTFPQRRRPRRGRNRVGGWAPALTPSTAVRIAILGGIAMGLLGLLLIRLWFLQVINGEQYAERADGNRLRTVITQPPRGNILTRDGVALVKNTIGKNVVARPRDLTGARRREVLARLTPLLGVPLTELTAKFDAADERAKAGQAAPLETVVLARNIDPALARILAERRRDFPGVSLEKTYLRAYPQGDLATHVLGLTGPIDARSIKDYQQEGYAGDESVGLDGVELQYEAVLKGTAGKSVVEVDAAGEPQGREYVSATSPVPGRDVRLSIHSATQRALQDALAEATRATGTSAAAGVALDPRSGEVIALASLPTYRPEAFVTRKAKDLDPILKNPNEPLNDRAIAGVYPAGSTFKPITASAALRGGQLTPDTPLESASKITLYKQEFKNFQEESHGVITLETALRVSSDTFFYQVADRLYLAQDEDTGTYPLQKEARRFGLGADTGIDLPGEQPALVPDPPWKKQRFAGPKYSDFQRSWLGGDTINLGVGQGYLQATPLQMAVAYGAIADGGTVRTPTVGLQVADPTGRVQQQLAATGPTHQLNIGADNLAAIKQGLYDAANEPEGTSTSVFGGLPDDKRVAGKTGTVETGVPGEEDHSWFVGYAPYDEPTIVIAVIIEHGGTGANAAAPAVCSTLSVNLGFDRSLCGQPVASR
jgi:penicillin-binding protein 2